MESDRRQAAEISKAAQKSATPAPEAGQNLEQLLAEAQPILEYIKQEKKIDAAIASLDPHWPEFERQTSDDARYLELVREVFDEERFAPLRFSVSDIKGAFEHVGYTSFMTVDTQMMTKLRDAMLHVANDTRRQAMALGLLLHLPDFVAAGRYTEACLLEYLAQETVEEKREPNPFIYEMFGFGYNAWIAQRRTEDEAALRNMGLDPDKLREMNPAELDSFAKSHASDTAISAALEEMFKPNSERRKESEANLEAMERNSTQLLDREDFRQLLLSEQEMLPWMAVFLERTQEQGFLDAVQAGRASKQETEGFVEQTAIPLARDMAEAIFTDERQLQLIADLKRYQVERHAAKDQKAQVQAMGAIMSLERSESPAQNPFLVSLCWMSLATLIKNAGGETIPAG